MALRELKIGASGVRGVVGDALTPELIVNFACAFGTWCGAGPVVIGRDTRRSSTALPRRRGLRAPVDGLPGDRPRRRARARSCPSRSASSAPRAASPSRAATTTRAGTRSSSSGRTARCSTRRRTRNCSTSTTAPPSSCATWDRLQAGRDGARRRGALPRAPRQRPRRRRDPRAAASAWPSTSPTARAAPSPRDSSSRCAARCFPSTRSRRASSPTRPRPPPRTCGRSPRWPACFGADLGAALNVDGDRDRLRHRRRHGALRGVLPAPGRPRRDCGAGPARS